jgi:hypothetical protein
MTIHRTGSAHTVTKTGNQRTGTDAHAAPKHRRHADPRSGAAVPLAARRRPGEHPGLSDLDLGL